MRRHLSLEMNLFEPLSAARISLVSTHQLRALGIEAILETKDRRILGIAFSTPFLEIKASRGS
jgi:hypothetical protein